MWNLFKRPVEQSSFEAWAKISDDIAKVAILTVPVMLYGKDPTDLKIINTLLLLGAIYAFLTGGRHFRQLSQRNS